MNILFKGNDGSVAIMTLAPGADKADAIKKFQAAHPGDYLEYIEGKHKLPESRQFRDAWTINALNRVVIDKNKALEIHLEHLRQLRNKKLEELDKEQLRHLADPAKLTELEEKKQVLRDIPQNHKGLDIPVELK